MNPSGSILWTSPGWTPAAMAADGTVYALNLGSAGAPSVNAGENILTLAP